MIEPGAVRAPVRLRAARRSLGPALVVLAIVLVAVAGAGLAPASAADRPGESVLALAGTCSPGLALSVIPGSGPVPLLVNFTLQQTVGTGGSIDWAFGDGGEWNSSLRPNTTVVHVYYAPGTFTATVSVPEAGGNGSCQATVSTTAPPLRIAITPSPTAGPAPLTVEFRANVTGGTGTYRSLDWSFGNGTNGSGFDIAETFSSPGTVAVLAVVTDSSGAIARAETNVSVSATPPVTTGRTNSGLSGSTLAEGIVGIGLLLAASLALLWFVRSRRETADPGAARRAESSVKPMVPATSSPVDLEVVEVRPEPARSPPRARRSRPRPPSDPTLTLSQQILLHLAGLGPIEWHEVTPLGYTQRGLGEALGVRQGFVSNVLARMTAAGLVAHDLRHVHGVPRRVKVYRLTPLGQSMARRLRNAPLPPSTGRPPPSASPRPSGASDGEPVGDRSGG